ncbi:MAG: enoyl-CoA hydratase/isomerase family protein [Desulfuromonadales bacterium]
MHTNLLTEIDARGLATVTMNRPELHNAFDDLMIKALTSAFRRLNDDPQVRVVLLAASGKSFSAGADLNWMRRMADYTREENLADSVALAGLMRTLYGLSKPTIALVQGAAYGGGVGLVACCDIALATDRATFCLSEVKLGLIPAVISPYVMEAIGSRAARRYFLTAERFDAVEAQHLGLVHELVAVADLRARGESLAALLIQNGPLALSAVKSLVADLTRMPVDDAMIAATAVRIADIRSSDEGKDGVGAFLQKRPPAWVKG